MIQVKTKTLSLLYSDWEDRMKLIINKNEEDTMEFWITRRFYFSLLFELETFLEQLHISPASLQDKNKRSKKEQSSALKKSSNDKSTLLENINIRFIKEKESFIFVFQSSFMEAESIFGMQEFLNFYSILKSSFPKSKWGII